MSDKEWYEGLPASELPGKHVHVVFSNATMDGCLNLQGEIPYWAEDDDLKYVQILEQGHDQVWRTAVGVESVSLVWDERDWEEISIEDIQRGDTIVVNGLVFPVKRVWDDGDFYTGCRYIHKSLVSCALRRRSKLPTEPGYYRNDSGIVVELTSGSPAEWWMLPTGSQDSQVSAEFVSSLLPLSPVHFVDGRAE